MDNDTEQLDSEQATELPDDDFADLKSQFYKFAIRERIWHTLVEPFMRRVRREERSQGKNKRESRKSAWLQAAEVFTEQTLQASKALSDVVAAEPLSLTGRQGASWRLSVMAISLTVRQTPTLISKTERLLSYIHTRIASRKVQTGNEHLNQADFDQAAREFSKGPQARGGELDRIASDVRGIVPNDDGLQKELSLVVQAICEDRTTMVRVLKDTWSSTSPAE